MMQYGFLSGMLFVLVEGMIAYMIDRRFGVRLVSWWNGMTGPAISEEQHGFIYQRKAAGRSSTAIAIVLLQNAALFFTGQISPLTSLISVFPEFFVMLGGFYMGPWLDVVWSRKQPVLDMIDDLESGKTTVGKELKEAAEVVKKSLGPLGQPVNIVHTTHEKQEVEKAIVPKPEVIEKQKTLAEQIEEDPLKYIREFSEGASKDGK